MRRIQPDTSTKENPMQATRTDVYTRVTDAIVAELERGVRPWLKPWNAEHMAGKITRPLRFTVTVRSTPSSPRRDRSR
jgi:antirestriction protein ArdC